MITWLNVLQAGSVALVALLGASCETTNTVVPRGLDFDTLNGALMRLQAEHNALRGMNSPNAMAQRTTLNLELRKVADSALEAAMRGQVKNLKIGYYRVAATADWIRDDDRAFTASKEGTDFCNEKDGNQENFNLAVRDCVTLIYVPFGLRADRLSAGLSAVSRDTSSGFVDRHRKEVLDLVEVYTGLGQQVPILTMKAVPNDLVDTMRDRRSSIKNDVEFLVGVFAANAMSPQDKSSTIAICNDLARDTPDIKPNQCP